MAEKRPDQLPAITGMSDNDIFIIQQNINDPSITNRTVGQISKKDVGFLAVSGGVISGPLNVSGDVSLGGDLTPASSGLFNLGSASKPWGTGYFTAGTIELGHLCLKAGRGGLIVENPGGGPGNFSGATGNFTDLYLNGERMRTGAGGGGGGGGGSDEVVRYFAASGESHRDLIFSKTHNSPPALIGNMVLGDTCENFYALSFSRLTLTGCRVLYSSSMLETGNAAHILIKKT